MSKAIPVESYTRTCGYYAPFSNVNKGKQEEIKERKLCAVNSTGFKEKLLDKIVSASTI